MKRLIGLLLVIGMLFSTLAVVATAETTPGFVIDGELDEYYLDGDEAEYLYYFPVLDGYAKTGANMGSAPYSELETDVVVYTAYDDDYVYFYVKVWDDDLVDWADDEGNVYPTYEGTDSSAGDSIEIWFDPDPLSVETTSILDDKGEEDDRFFKQTLDATQGDVRFRMQGYDFFINDFKNLEKPGYDGVLLGDYFYDTANVYPFHFYNEPREIEATGITVSSGYGVEARFPRNDDDSNSYRFNVAVNNSAIQDQNRYALALGAAWWLSFSGSIVVEYEDVNPFLSNAVVPGPEPQPTPTPGEVVGVRGDVDGSTKTDAGDALMILKYAVGKQELTDAQKVIADLDGNSKIDAGDALTVLKIAVGKA